MSELEDILNYLETTSLEPHDDYVSEFSYKDQKTLWKYIKELQQENQELKKQLEEMDSKLFFTKNELEMRQKTIDNKLRQQNEFIEWLDSMLVSELGVFTEVKICDVLSKYKEIIGDD